jgi:hypothetical protein
MGGARLRRNGLRLGCERAGGGGGRLASRSGASAQGRMARSRARDGAPCGIAPGSIRLWLTGLVMYLPVYHTRMNSNALYIYIYMFFFN